jgi:SAM-dependent methyltransferase
VTDFSFACPRCRTLLDIDAPAAFICPADGLVFPRVDGIWRMLLPEREGYFRSFIEQYEAVRQAEGWGTESAAYYRALPFEDLSGRFPDIWRMRSLAFQLLVDRVTEPAAVEKQRPLKIVDVGAGNGWLAYRLAQRGHHVAAVDLQTNRADGLGAHGFYDAAFTPIQAEFQRLPLTDDQADLVIFAATLHYATSAREALREAIRVLRPDGRLVVMESPTYHDPASGEQMVREREERFEQTLGIRGDTLERANYLTFDGIEILGRELGLSWQRLAPNYGLRWRLRPYLARLLRSREPATFQILVGRH